MRSFATRRWLALFLTIVLGACGDSGGGTNNGTNGTNATGWTVLVYVAGDNDLEPAIKGNIEQMAAVGSSTGLNIVAQVDRAVGFYEGPVLNLPNWTSTKRLLVQPGSLTEVADLGETNMSDPNVLADFIQWGIKTYPAAHYMLVLWDHGGGWQGYGLDILPAIGATKKDWMSISKVQSAIKNGLAATSVPKLDIVGFDACLMATLEIAELMKPYAGYLLASEEVIPAHGWDYKGLQGAAALDALTLSKNIANAYQSFANASKTGASITLSVVDLQKLSGIETAITKLSTDYGTASTMRPISGSLGRQRSAAIEFGASPDPAQSFNLVDLGDLFSKLTNPLGADATAIQTSVSSAVVYQVRGSAFANASGLAIYFPPSSTRYDTTIYGQLPGMTEWRTFLSTYYATGSSGGTPVITTGSYSAQNASVTVDVTLAPGSLALVTNAYLFYGIPATGGGAWVLGDTPAQLATVSGADHVQGSWDYSVLRLTQGTPATHQEYGYLSVRQQSATEYVAIIPLSYYATSTATAEDAFRAIVFDSTGNITSDAYYLVSNGLVGALTPASGSLLRAVVALMPDPNTWSMQYTEYASSGGFDATKPIDLDFPYLPTGTQFFVGIAVENAAGQADFITSDPASPPTRP